jgi:hypothetical protein
MEAGCMAINVPDFRTTPNSIQLVKKNIASLPQWKSPTFDD